MPSTNRILVLVGITLPAFFAILVGLLQWNSSLGFRTSRQEVFYIRTVLLAIQDYFSTLQDAETGQRGYLLTGKPSYLAPYLGALARKGPQIAALHQLLARDSVQDKNLTRLEMLADTKLKELGQTVDLEKQGNHAAAIAVVQSDFGKNTMDQIRVQVQDMQKLENDLLERRESAYQQRSELNLALSAALLGIESVCIVTIFFLLRRIDKYEDMVKICAWSKMIEYQGEWLSIEEYLSKRLHAKVTHGISETQAALLLNTIAEAKAAPVLLSKHGQP